MYTKERHVSSFRLITAIIHLVISSCSYCMTVQNISTGVRNLSMEDHKWDLFALNFDLDLLKLLPCLLLISYRSENYSLEHHRQSNIETKCENIARHVNVCRQPKETCFQWDKGNSLLLLSEHEACCRVGWMAPLPWKQLIFLQHAQTACSTALNCPHDSNTC